MADKATLSARNSAQQLKAKRQERKSRSGFSSGRVVRHLNFFTQTQSMWKRIGRDREWKGKKKRHFIQLVPLSRPGSKSVIIIISRLSWSSRPLRQARGLESDSLRYLCAWRRNGLFSRSIPFKKNKNKTREKNRMKILEDEEEEKKDVGSCTVDDNLPSRGLLRRWKRKKEERTERVTITSDGSWRIFVVLALAMRRDFSKRGRMKWARKNKKQYD